VTTKTRRTRRTRNDQCSKLENKRMNKETYAERRKVMAWVYRAKDLLRAEGIEMPRVQIRICEESTRTLGVATLNDRLAIWISQTAIDEGSIKLGETVLHELAHTLFNAPHVDGCPLMHPCSHPKANLPACERVFVELARAHAA
jgi:hypothetical protein